MEDLDVGDVLSAFTAIVVMLIGVFLRQQSASVSTLRQDDKALSNQITDTERRLTDKINELEVTVAQNYMPRGDAESKFDRLFDAVDHVRNLVTAIATGDRSAGDDHK
ncbi:MAG: hypothetical protein AAFY29_22785 [Pseudomonadota bacterium]